MAKGKHKRTRGVSGARVVGVGIAVVVFALAGCSGSKTQAGTSSGRPVIGPFRAEDENPFLRRSKEPTDRQEVVRLTIYRVTIKNQEQNKVAELWKLFRPVALPGDNAGLLAGNGLAIGSGGAKAWTEAVNLLEVDPGKPWLGGNKVQQWETALAEGFAAELGVSSSIGGVTFFWHEADGRLVGRTYGRCQKLLVITAAVRPTGGVQIKLVPALKEEGKRARALRRFAMMLGKEPEEYVAKFDRLGFEGVVSSDEFLIIGSGAEADETSFGRAFFDEVDAQRPSRTVLLIIPRAISPEQLK